MSMTHLEEMLSSCRHLYSGEKAGPTSKGSLGAELVDGLVIKDGDYKVVKTRFSAFFATHLNSFLKTAGISSLVVIGKCISYCILLCRLQIIFLYIQLLIRRISISRCSNSKLHQTDRL